MPKLLNGYKKSAFIIGRLGCYLWLAATGSHVGTLGSMWERNLSDDLTNLWLGMDTKEEHDFRHAGDAGVFREKPSRPSLRRHRGGADPQRDHLEGEEHYVLTGPFDSGTNLMRSLIEENFPSAKQKIDLWKHSLGADGIYDLLHMVTGNNTWPDLTLVAMVRSPLSQVYSWHEAPYDLRLCMVRDWREMRNPCSAALGPYLADHKSYRLLAFKSTVDVYNHYMRQLRRFQQDKRFREILVVPYEDVVLTPDEVVAALARSLRLPPPKHVKHIDAPAKDHGHTLGRDAALARLQARPWLEVLGDMAQETLCKSLDVTLLEGLQEGSYLEQSELRRPYAQDCSFMFPVVSELR